MVYISPGNRKMKIPTFSLPSIMTCPNATPLCKKYCYAKKAERAYPNVLPSRTRNYIESGFDDFVINVSKYIIKKGFEYFRIHESGDFYSQKYFDDWCKIAHICKSTKFLAYTQVYDLDFTLKPDNLIIYWTIWPDSKDVPKDGLKAYVVDDGKHKISNKLDKYKAFRCKKETIKGMTCDKCLHCFEGKGDVKFKLH